MKYKKAMKRMFKALIIIVLVVLAGDFGYSLYVKNKLNAWESGVERDPETHVMKNCESYSAGSGSKAILLVHGINDTPFTWRKFTPVLEDQFHVRAMRMPGFGEPIPAYAQYRADDWVTAVTNEAKRLRKDHDEVYVVAHSLGGAVTIRAALEAGQDQNKLFDGMILLAPAIEVSNRRSPVLPTRVWHNVSSLLVFTNTTYNPFGNDAKDPEAKDAPNRIKFTPRSIIIETFGLIDHNRGRAAEVNVPVLMVLSNEDQVNDYIASEKWVDKISSDRKEIYWNNRSGHALQYDIGWQDVAEKIVTFVNDDSD